MDEATFLEQIRLSFHDDELRLVYADWLEEQGRIEAELVRLEIGLSTMPVDDPARLGTETEFSRLTAGIDEHWKHQVLRVGPPRDDGDCCLCLNQKSELRFHRETQDTECDAWHQLLELIEKARRNGDHEFSPLEEIDDGHRIITLPPEIGMLKDVRRLHLYGSRLRMIPPEIGEMASLEQFFPYTSYQLHWFPWEITRCRKLADSGVSTRALYGNQRTRVGFPQLGSYASLGLTSPRAKRPCSVCRKPFKDKGEFRVWISRGVATDVIPMLVNACSMRCVEQLPRPAKNHISHVHRGGNVIQPPTWG